MIDRQTRVAELAAQSLAAIRVFQKHGIDFCCGGQRPIADVCASAKLSESALLGELETALAAPAEDPQDWSRTPLRALISHIVTRHHSYLRSELPRIQSWLDKVYSKYGQQDAAILGPVPDTFAALRAELESHLPKEEMILFPWIERVEAALDAGLPAPRLPFGTLEGPLGVMEHEHETAGEALRTLHETTNGYQPPEHACRTYRALFEALAELESDLHMHIHLENNVLHPRVRALVGAR